MPKTVQLVSPNRPRTTIGQMRQEVKVLTYGDAPFGEYSLKRTYVEVATVRARIVNISGSGSREGKGLDANITHTVVIRKPEFELTTENMLEWTHAGTNEYLRPRQVRPVGKTSNDPREQYMMILCESQGLKEAFKDPSPEPTEVTLASIALTGPSSVVSGSSTQYTLTGTYSDSSEQDLTAEATWGDSSGTATIVGGLLVTERSFIAGHVCIFATINGFVDVLEVELTAAIPILPLTNLIQHMATATADGLTLQSSVGSLSDMEIANVTVVEFGGAGSGEYGRTALNPNDSTVIEWSGRMLNSGTGASQYMVGVGGTNGGDDRFFAGVGSSGKWRAAIGNAFTDSVADADTDWHDFKLTVDGFYIDNVLTVDPGSSTIGTPSHFTRGIALGCYVTSSGTPSALAECRISVMKITDAQEGSAYYAFDDGELAGFDLLQVGGPAMTALFGNNATENGVPSHLDRYGFRLDGGVKISALLDGSSAADGNPITNLPAPMNGSGTTRIQTDASLVNDPFWANTGVLIEKTQAEIEANNADTDSNRSVNVSPSVLESILYSSAPTGDDLIELNAYIALKEAE